MKKSRNVLIIAVMLAAVLLLGTSMVFAQGESLQAVAADFKFLINGEDVEFSEQAVVIDGRTYLPVRAFGQAMDKRVGWDNNTRTVIINDALQDGIYEAAAEEFNEHGWKSMIKIEVVDGQITAVNYDEINQEGVYKTKDEEYLKQYKEVTGTDMIENFNNLQTSLVNVQSADKVDAVTSASHSSNIFINLAKQALEAGPVQTDEQE